MSVRAHLGNELLKSGNEVTPGQSFSVGVPRTLRDISTVLMDIIETEYVPEDLEDLVDL
jgi:hypothetical protein